jgi:hypothetical protein
MFISYIYLRVLVYLQIKFFNSVYFMLEFRPGYLSGFLSLILGNPDRSWGATLNPALLALPRLALFVLAVALWFLPRLVGFSWNPVFSFILRELFCIFGFPN